MITFCPSSNRMCVRPLTFSNDFSEAAEPNLLKFHMEPPNGWGKERLLKWSESVD